MDKKELRDTQRMFNLALNSPYTRGQMYEFDGESPLKSFEGKNMDVKSIMFAKLIEKFFKTGDVKYFEAIMKYSGNEPTKDSSISLELPTIINDIPAGPEKKPKVGLNFTVYDDSDESVDH